VASKGPSQPDRKRRLARVVVDWLYDQALEAMLGAALTVVLIAGGIGYEVDDDRLDQAAIVASKQAGASEMRASYEAFVSAKRDFAHRVKDSVPEVVVKDVRAWSLGIAGGLLVSCVVLALLRAPSRAHIFKALGWGMLSPGLIAALVTIVLEWRALRGVRATLSGELSLDVLLGEATTAARDAGGALWPALVGGVVFFSIGVWLHRRWRDDHGVELAPRHVASHFFIVLGAVPWIHYGVAIVLDALTIGNSTGASVAPWSQSPGDYLTCAALFSLGAAFWVLARHEIRRLELEEAKG
jgi:hypothetical protein